MHDVHLLQSCAILQTLALLPLKKGPRKAQNHVGLNVRMGIMCLGFPLSPATPKDLSGLIP